MDYSEWFTYRDGELYWKRSSKNKKFKEGDRVVSGFHCGGYRRVAVNGKRALLHRVIYQIFNGPINNGFEIDHINLDRGDNRIENLRLCTRSQNLRNTKAHKNNKTGIKGVQKIRYGYKAEIRVFRKSFHLGCFKCPIEAKSVYDAWSNFIGGEFARK